MEVVQLEVDQLKVGLQRALVKEGQLKVLQLGEGLNMVHQV